MDNLKALAETIVKNTSAKKTEAYETTATVVRIDGEKVYVHIDGGAPETPATATMACKIGDTVRIHVEGGRAWIIGNVSAPATDDTTAEEASGKIDAYKKYVNTIIREYEDGVLVCKAGKNIGALVNSSGSFDVVKVNWSGTTPEPKGKIASFGGNLVQIGESDGNNIVLSTEDIGAPGLVIKAANSKGNCLLGVAHDEEVGDIGTMLFDGRILSVGLKNESWLFFQAPEGGESGYIRSQVDFRTDVLYATKANFTDITAEDISATGRVTSGKESTEIQLTNGASGYIYLHRKGDIASVYITGAKLGAGTVNRTIATVPEGWRPVRQTAIPIDGSSDALLFLNSDGTISCRYNSSTQRQIWGRVTYIAWA